ncbi:MAG: hypothetical protein RIC80_00810 [Cyclobacteriaceae bacterium]
MMKTVVTTARYLFLSLFLFSCGTDDSENAEPERGGLGANEVVFSDDNIVCTPFSSAVTIGEQGILSVIMNPCQNSSSKLDGYFANSGRPAPGTYTIVGTAGSFPNITTIGAAQFTMIFYNHYTDALYSTSGTVELTVNADDNSKLDMVWNEVIMEAGDGYSVEFSGRFIGI